MDSPPILSTANIKLDITQKTQKPLAPDHYRTLHRSDATETETTAKREGSNYIINGKERFITNAELADIYVVYAKTSEKTEDKAKYRHLTAFLVEKRALGFSVEKINELSGWIGLPNGILDFNNVRVLVKDSIGPEGEGWKVMMAGLNFERVVYSAGMLGPMRESIRHAVAYAQRRMQFNKPTIDMPSNSARLTHRNLNVLENLFSKSPI